MSDGSRPDFLARNLEALTRGGQAAVRDWLERAPRPSMVTEIEAADGGMVLMVGGQTQASRRDPRREAEAWLTRARAENAGAWSGRLVLFGLGGPWPMALILEERPLAVYEPDPGVLQAILRRHDFSRHLAAPAGRGLLILTPWDLARNPEQVRGATVLVHPPAQRRAAAQLANLRRLAAGGRRGLASGTNRPLTIMVVPPLSGGSLPVASSLARAVEAGGHTLHHLDWPARFREMEQTAHRTPGAEAGRLIARLFEEAGQTALQAASDGAPDLILALAQAPLDAPNLARLREAGEAPLAFWLVEDVRLFGYVAEVAPAYDALFHIQEGLIEDRLRDWGLGRAAYLPLAADPDLFRPLPEDFPNAFRADLSFMGAGYPNRRRLLADLASGYWSRTGRPAESFRIFGSGWAGADPALRPHLFEGGRRVSLAENALIYAGGQVNLNLHSSALPRPGFEPGSRFVNPRTFEIAAAESFQIVDHRPLLPPLFAAGRELAVAESPADLPDLIDHYLGRPEERQAMGRAARERVLAEHTYGHRLDHILASLGWTAESETGPQA